MSLPNRDFNPGPRSWNSSEWLIPLSAPHFSQHEAGALGSTLNSGWWTYGQVARQVEEEFAQYIGVRHAIAVSSGTAALHLAFLALGVGAADEILTPSLNFVAAANMILHCGAQPRFVDVASLDIPLVSVDTLDRSRTAQSRGICLMHYGGYPCDMEAVMSFAREHGMWVIEDAAHAPGASWQRRRCGAWGDAACFSFFGNKNLTCGEGGMVVTQRDDVAEKVRSLRSHGMSSLTWDRYRGHQFSYDVLAPGFNYRMDDLHASLLRVQLHSLDQFNRLRQERVEWYRGLLGDSAHWSIPFEAYPGFPAYHIFVVVLNGEISRADVMVRMRAQGIQTSVHYPPIHRFTFFRKLSLPFADLRTSEALGRRVLTLPLYPDMTREQVQQVCTALHNAVHG